MNKYFKPFNTNLFDSKASDIQPNWSGAFQGLSSGISSLSNASDFGDALGSTVGILASVVSSLFGVA